MFLITKNNKKFCEERDRCKGNIMFPFNFSFMENDAYVILCNNKYKLYTLYTQTNFQIQFGYSSQKLLPVSPAGNFSKSCR